MAISFGGNSALTSGGVTSRTLGIPSGHAAGSLLLSFVGLSTTATTSITGGSGTWNKYGQLSAGGVSLSVFWRIATSGSETAPTVSWSGSANVMTQTSYWNGTDTSTPIVQAGSASTGSGATHTSSQITTLYSNSVAIMTDFTSASGAAGLPSGWTSAASNSSAPNSVAQRVVYKSVASPGGTGTTSVTGTAATWITVQYELVEPIPVTKSLVYDPVPLAHLFVR